MIAAEVINYTLHGRRRQGLHGRHGGSCCAAKRRREWLRLACMRAEGGIWIDCSSAVRTYTARGPLGPRKHRSVGQLFMASSLALSAITFLLSTVLPCARMVAIGSYEGHVCNEQTKAQSGGEGRRERTRLSSLHYTEFFRASFSCSSSPPVPQPQTGSRGSMSNFYAQKASECLADLVAAQHGDCQC